MTSGTAPVAVLGLGNVLMGDDAVGPHVVALLRAGWSFPPEVELRDLGTPGLDLHPHLAGRRAVVLLDAVRIDTRAADGDDAAAVPGEVRLYGREALLVPPPGPRLDPHAPGVAEALLALEFAGEGPDEVLLVGVVAGSVAAGVGLSAAVREAVPRAAAAVVAQLARLGQAPRPRARPPAPDIWWEAPREPARAAGRRPGMAAEHA